MASLRFEEFSALRRRQKATSEPRETADMPPPVLTAHNAGYFFETFEVQLLTLVLIAFDVVAAVATMLLTCSGNTDSAFVRAVLNVLESFTGFTIFFFILELAALVLAFRSSFFAHLGNLVDTVVVGVCLFAEVNGESRGIRILGLLRGWRLMRLVSTVLKMKDRELERTNDEWQIDQQLLEEARLEVARLEDSIRREMDSKKRVETMLKSYKDEVETLNEALKIAALDIANTAGDQLLSDDESDGETHDPKSKAGRAQTTVFIKQDGSFSLRDS